MSENDNETLDNKHSMDIGNSSQEISTNTRDQVFSTSSLPSATTLLPLTPIESTFVDGISENGSYSEAQVDGSMAVDHQKLAATTNIEEELVPGEFSAIIQGLFTIFKSNAHFHYIRPHNKLNYKGLLHFVVAWIFGSILGKIFRLIPIVCLYLSYDPVQSDVWGIELGSNLQILSMEVKEK
ncbi:hypothetical protein RND71_022732 [Anisodus tanguticus]|uniref:Uncharacterized protein n=1 Tax=Anisodus tanguticus TaxID=243964 RepID=A0AAE1RU91_9SOLA|nr:hypothetical protein RND71_022732 [Anisodus tanguticus]